MLEDEPRGREEGISHPNPAAQLLHCVPTTDREGKLINLTNSIVQTGKRRCSAVMAKSQVWTLNPAKPVRSKGSKFPHS